MHTPFDYQLDYLNGIHLIYAAFPQPINVTYYRISNTSELHSATEVTKSTYTHILDNTSVAKFVSLDKIPVYFVEGNQPKAQQANEYGSIFNQPQITCVMPSIYGFEPLVNEFISFEQTGPNRLYKIENIEISNMLEGGTLRSYKLTLRIDTKFKEDITPKLELFLEFNRKLATVLMKEDSVYIENTILPLLNIFLKQLDSKSMHQNNKHILSKLYNDFKIYFSILINYNSYEYLDLLSSYEGNFHSYFLENPSVYLNDIQFKNEAEDLIEILSNKNDLDNISENNIYKNLLIDINNKSLKFMDYGSVSELSKIIIINFILQALDTIVTGKEY